MTAVNSKDWPGFPPGTIRLEKPELKDIREMPDGSFDITLRFTRLTMTATERARQVAWSLIDQPAANAESAVAELLDRDRAERIIAAAIAAAERDAVAAERERCARIAERRAKSMSNEGTCCESTGLKIAAAIREGAK